MYKLTDLGYNDFYEEEHTPAKLEKGRVATSANGIYKVFSTQGVYMCHTAGRFYHRAESARDFPCVGDWVVFEALPGENKGLIQQVLKRKSLLSRQAAGDKQEEQLIAANVDTVFLVNALNKDFNLRRMERYLTQVYDSGASPVFLLTKRDLCSDPEEKMHQVEEIAPAVPVLTVDACDTEDIEEIKQFCKQGHTVSLIGSSGVGKSTLINRLMGKEVQKTQNIRADDAKGKHTTTNRELFLLPGGSIIIDTPGMRELQLWAGDRAADETFEDIDELADGCKFRDCQHDKESGCTVQQAIETGSLSAERFRNYKKLKKETKYLDLKAKYGSNRAARIQVTQLMKGKW